MDSVLILTEAGDKIGFGHLMRCSAVQACLEQHGVETLLFLNFVGVDNAINQFTFRRVNWLRDLAEIESYSDKFRIAIIDSYLALEKHFDILRALFKYIIVFDDYNRITYPVDLIINPNIYLPLLDYNNQHAQVIGGQDYVILRPSFTENKYDFKVRQQMTNIFLSVGGSDYRGLIPAILEKLREYKYSVDVVAGTENYRKKLAEYANKSCRIHGYVESSKMVSLMLNADIAISAAGQTLHELAYLRIPVIAICIDEDQQLNMESYYQNDFLTECLNWNAIDLFDRLEALLLKLQNYAVRQELSLKAKTIIDGKGTKRIYSLLNNKKL